MVPKLRLSKILFYLFSLTIVASVFQAMGISVGGGAFPLVPVVILQIIFVFVLFLYFCIADSFRLPEDSRVMVFWLKLFLMYSIFFGLALPLIFEGMPVFSPRLGIDNQVDNQTPLVFTVSNIGQIIYLLINCFFFIGGIFLYQKGDKIKALNALLSSGFIVAFFALYQKINFDFGIWFPYEIINSNDIYKADAGSFIAQSIGGIQRVSSTFTESSNAGNVLGTFFTYYLFLLFYGKKTFKIYFFLAVYLICTLLTTSSIGYGQLFFSIVLFALLSINKPVYILYLLILLIFVVGGGSIYNNEALLAATLNKTESLSFFNRFASDAHALTILLDTYGFGVGLGGNRPSSFFTYMLSNVGLIGSGFFLMFVLALVKPFFRKDIILEPEQKALFFGLLSHLFGKFMGVPDLNFWFFWALLAVTSINLRNSNAMTSSFCKKIKLTYGGNGTHE